jgi:hypothetical protein
MDHQFCKNKRKWGFMKKLKSLEERRRDSPSMKVRQNKVTEKEEVIERRATRTEVSF